jgi:rhomboid protease GluP
MAASRRGSYARVNRGFTMTKLLIAVNVIVFLVLSIWGNTQDAQFMADHGALWTPYVLQYHEYYRLVTSQFLHFGFMHLFNNMLLLYFMGDVLEQIFGKAKFLIFYLLTGVCGNLLTMLYEQSTGSYAVSAGASGAIFGVLGGLLFLILKYHGRVSYMSTGQLVFFIVYSLVAGYTSGGVNNMAHLGGLIGGFLLSPLFCAVDFKK